MDDLNFFTYSLLKIIGISAVLLNSSIFRFLIKKLIDSFKDED